MQLAEKISFDRILMVIIAEKSRTDITASQKRLIATISTPVSGSNITRAIGRKSLVFLNPNPSFKLTSI